jgi:hypothetical protein
MVPGIASPTPRRSLIGAQTALLAVFLAAGSLVACSGEPRSLASYIAAICSTPFRSAPAAEAPYLAENVAAMTKMMIDMGIQPSGDVDADFVVTQLQEIAAMHLVLGQPLPAGQGDRTVAGDAYVQPGDFR